MEIQTDLDKIQPGDRVVYALGYGYSVSDHIGTVVMVTANSIWLEGSMQFRRPKGGKVGSRGRIMHGEGAIKSLKKIMWCSAIADLDKAMQDVYSHAHRIDYDNVEEISRLAAAVRTLTSTTAA